MINVFHIGARGDPVSEWKDYDTTIYGFDPNEQECNRLSKKHPEHFFYPIALGARNETRLFYVTEQPECSSLLNPNIANWVPFERDDRAEIKKVIEIETETLDSVCKKIRAYPTFIKIDTQGTELEILKSYSNLYNVAGIETEVFFYDLYENQSLFYEVYSFLADLGFSLYGLKRCRWNGRLIFGDALFLKEGTYFHALCHKYKINTKSNPIWDGQYA